MVCRANGPWGEGKADMIASIVDDAVSKKLWR
jgi:hypothetical protein